MELVSLWLFVGTGLLVAILGIPLWKRKVAPNYIYGLRTRETLSNDGVWYEANSRSGVYAIVTGTAIAVVALATYLLGLPDPAGTWINAGFLLVSVLVMGVRGVLLGRELAKRATCDDGETST